MNIEPAIDCHAHIIDPERFAFVRGAGYTPQPHETGLRESFLALLDRHGVRHVLLVQPSCYAFDNSAMLDAIAKSPDRFKGIAVVNADIGDKEVRRMAELGVVGIRFNLVTFDRGMLQGSGSSRLLARLKECGWFAQIYADDDQWTELAPVLERSGVKLLIDHFGVRDARHGIASPGFEAVLALGRSGNAVVKLSAPFRIALQANGYAQLDAHAEALLQAFGIAHCVWGSDWPFLGIEHQPDYGTLRDPLCRWLPDARQRAQVLWDNPARLFGW
jgi:predicted TIM-barrel fold metal-dependent hydrolase